VGYGPQFEKPVPRMSKQLRLSGAACHKPKANRKEYSMKYVGSTDKCVKKAKKIGRK